MPRVHKLKAAKDYPEIGVSRGETYYKWSIKRQRGGVVRKSKTYPKPQQLTENPFRIACYDINDAIDAATDFEGLMAVKDDVESLRDDVQASLDNMPEGLQQGDTGQLLQERIDALEEVIQAFESAEEPDEDCEDCDGTGKQLIDPDSPEGGEEDCEACSGLGKKLDADLDDLKAELTSSMPS